ncbi:serine/threonine protein kinase [Hyalangium versicolor]|uniref:serine/threonine protein kinase n=1 Tax=Hyalangium versicolor TaxID=2861190 RepID=UPI001CCB4E74|nr:protein kinase [Hyalangium versicolor]
MAAIEFRVPKGAILFSQEGISYEFRENLGEAHHGLNLLLARQRMADGKPLGKVLLKAVGMPRGLAGARVYKAREKLEEQVRLAAYLQHPGILRVHGMHKAEAAWYVITDHPSGNSLNDVLALVMECERWFSPFFALYVGAQVAGALHHAHTAKDEKGRSLGIVHRAIDLEHIFVDWAGRVQVSDFGVALSGLPGRVASTVRRPQGDTYFSSPEMLLTGRVDARSDLFALGLVMLELATGRNLLYAGNGIPEKALAALSRKKLAGLTRALKRARLAGCDDAVAETIMRAATYTPEDVEAATAGLPDTLRVPLCKLLQRSPAARYQTAGELEADLRRWLGETFGANEAGAELKAVADEAGEHMVDMGLPRPRPRARTQDTITTN